MDEKTKNELMAAVTGAVSEVNSKWEEYWAKVDTLLAEISQLKADIAQKEADIKQLQADYDKEAAAKGDALLREYAQTLIEYIEHYLRFEGAQGDMVSGLIDEKLDQLGDIYYLASYADRKEVVAELNDYYRSLGVSEENLIDVGDKRQQPDSALLPAAK
jgi:outer membrane murein-binding lipoprotein Lpp